MPLSYINYTGNGSTTDFAVTFPYLNASDVLVSVNGTPVGFTMLNSTTVRCAAAPGNGTTVKVYRSTQVTNGAAVFTGASTLTSNDLNLAVRQALYASQEANDALADQGALAAAGNGTGLPNSVAANDFLVGNGSGGAYVRQSLASTQSILGINPIPAGVASRFIGTNGSALYTLYTAADFWTNLGGPFPIAYVTDSRTLGSAALKTAGSADGNVPLLATVAGKVSLPAVSGQQLTEIMRGIQQARFEMRTGANVQPFSYDQIATNAAFSAFNKRALTDQIVNNIGATYTQLTSPGANNHNGSGQGEIVLPAGTYLFEVEASLASSNLAATDYIASFLRLYDVTNTTEKYRGVTTNRTGVSLYCQGSDRLSAVVTTAGATFRVDHWIGVFKIADHTTGGSPTIKPGHTPGTAPTPNVHTVINITKLLIQ
jgi:hypothetical protein